MHTIATILNICLLLMVAYLLRQEGVPKSGDVWIYFLLISTPVVSLLALRFANAQDWLALFLRRKALEERKKIEDLNRKA